MQSYTSVRLFKSMKVCSEGLRHGGAETCCAKSWPAWGDVDGGFTDNDPQTGVESMQWKCTDSLWALLLEGLAETTMWGGLCSAVFC